MPVLHMVFDRSRESRDWIDASNSLTGTICFGLGPTNNVETHREKAYTLLMGEVLSNNYTED